VAQGSHCFLLLDAYAWKARPANRQISSSRSNSTLMPVSEQNLLRNASVRPGAAISSANPGALSTNEPCQSIVKGLLSGIADGRVAILKGDNHIDIDRSRHRSRIARVQRMIAFFPDPIPRLPIPRYLANGLFALTARTLTPLLSSSNSNTSPARTPSALRVARGTVIRPFDVIFAWLSNDRTLGLPRQIMQVLI
jgi:hypothetical protein